MAKSEKWEGGEIRVDREGRRTFWVRRRLAGRRWHFSLLTGDLDVALAEYRRFRANPFAFRSGVVEDAPVLLDAELAKKFLLWSRAKGNTDGYITAQKGALAWWAGKLFDRDLRKLEPRELHDAVRDASGRKHKIAAIKVLFTWLRKDVHLLTGADPSGALRVPQSRPEQWVRSKIIPREHIEAVRAFLPARYRDALDVLAGTGWHKTELERFARSGSVAELPPQRKAEGAAMLLCPKTKRGAPLRTIVSEEVAAAARRLVELKPDYRSETGNPISGQYLNKAIAVALERANKARGRAGLDPITPFTAGSFRHTVATWAIEAGAPPEAVAAFLDHRSPATTKRFYATLAAPPKVPTLR